jgi:hypothetical protein
MSNSRGDMLKAALTKYPFRERRALESLDAYLAAVVDHLRKHDWALSEEIRIGKRQADWNKADVTAFERRILSRPRSTSQDAIQGTITIMETVAALPATEAALLEVAAMSLDGLAGRRRNAPAAPLPIVAHVLMMTGTLLTAFPSTDQRIALLKMLAQQAPVFGFVLTFDAFIHAITSEKSATKVDCLLQHIGTRDLRLVRRRPYRLIGSRVVFDDPPPEDIDSRATDWRMEDPYADIFVSVPPSQGVPS